MGAALTSDPESPVEMEGVAATAEAPRPSVVTDSGTEQPHTLFSNDLVLDLILSSLDGKSQLTARLVCKKWNDRILTNFRKKLALRLYGEEEPAAIRKKLKDVDPRLLSSLKIDDCRVFRGVVESWAVGHLRWLQLEWADKKALNCLIRVANKGHLCNLEELKIEIRGYITKMKETPTKILRSNVFPKLKRLKLKVFVLDDTGGADLEDYKDFLQAAGYLETFASFVSAAHNLLFLGTNLAFDLSGLKDLKTLNISTAEELFTEEEAIRMTESAKKLTSLKLDDPSGDLATGLDWTLLPGLKKLHLGITSYLAAEKLREILDLALKIKIPHLVVKLYGLSAGVNNIFELLSLFRKSEAKQKHVQESQLTKGDKGLLRILEFHHKYFGQFIMGDVSVEDLPSIMEKLKRKWDVVKFQGFFCQDSSQPGCEVFEGLMSEL